MKRSNKTALSILTAAISALALSVMARAEPSEMGTPAVGNSTGDIARGEEVYNGTCIACHGENGKGAVPGAPNFTKSDGVLSQADSVLIDHMVNGFQSDGALLEMPALGGNPDLSEQDMADVLAYIRDAFVEK